MTTTEHSYTTAPQLSDTLKRYSAIATFIGLVFLALTVAGIFLGGGMEQFMRSYLVGFWLWFGCGAGCLVILMTQYLTGGAWGVVIRRPLEAGAKTLYVFAPLFLPLLIFREKLYWWTTPEGLADKVIHAKCLYLNIPFLWVRWGIYALFFIGFTKLLTGWSKSEDETKSMDYSSKLEKLSAPGVLIFFLLMTFCAVDYLMTLEPYWYSTVYGFMMVIGGCLTAMSVIVATLTMLAKYEPMEYVLTKRHLHDLGKLMLALVMLWVLINLFGIRFFARINNAITSWKVAIPVVTVLILLIGHFILPFLLLLSQDLKKNPKTIAAIAIYLVVVHAVDVFSLVEPNFPTFQKPVDPHFTMSWLDVASPVGFGGLWLALFFRNLPGMPLLPLGAPDLKKALTHGRDH